MLKLQSLNIGWLFVFIYMLFSPATFAKQYRWVKIICVLVFFFLWRIMMRYIKQSMLEEYGMRKDDR